MIVLAIQLIITPMVATSYANTRIIDPTSASLSQLASASFVPFALISGGSLVAAGHERPV